MQNYNILQNDKRKLKISECSMIENMVSLVCSECVIKLYLMSTLLWCAIIAPLSGLASAPDKIQQSGPVQKNNLVNELASADIKTGNNLIRFNNPRNGWVFFTEKEYGSSVGEFELKNAANDVQRVKLDKYESMRRLNVGEYTVSFKASNNQGRFIIRSIPELQYSRFVPTTDAKSPDGTAYELSTQEKHGRDGMYLYYWDYLNANILRNFNVIIHKPEDYEVKAWLASGKKILLEVCFLQRKTWHEGFQYPFSGICIDEFVPPVEQISNKDKLQGGYQSGLGFEKDIFTDICKLMAPEKNKNHGAVYAYLGIPSSIATLENCSPLMDVIDKTNSYWIWEAYIWPDSTQPEQPINKWLIGRMNDLRKTFPCCQKNCVVCLCPVEMWDSTSDVDMKVWLDWQMNTLATHQAFESIYGVTFWTSTYTKPEILEWFSALIRHYCIEGKTSLLSEKYGYSLKPRHLENNDFSDFSDNLNGWKVTAASKESVQVKNLDQFSFKKGYYPKCQNLLAMKKEEGKSNRIEQEIKGLRSGELYSLSLRVGSPDVENVKVNYNLHVNIEGVKILKNENRVIRGDIANNICWNAIDIVFKAQEKKAFLAISDGNPCPDKPKVKEIFLDNIKVQPFYSLKNTQ